MIEIEAGIPKALASKTADLKELVINYMSGATSQMKEALASMVCDIIKLSPSQLRLLELYNSGLEESAGDQICDALTQTNFSSLKFIYL